MSGGRRRAVVVVAMGVAVLSAIPSAASAATITACVKSKTGELRVRSGAAAKRKCAKGWKRIQWGSSGVAGKQGIPGIPGVQGTPGLTAPAFSLKDATGVTIGPLLGIFPQGGAIYSVLRDGGIYTYLGSGQVYPLGGSSPNFKAADCSGPGVVTVSPSGSLSTATYVGLLADPFRYIFRTVAAGVFSPTRAWKGAGTSETIAAPTQLYEINSTGTCVADGLPFTGDVVLLTEVPAPPDFPGPLRIG